MANEGASKIILKRNVTDIPIIDMRNRLLNKLEVDLGSFDNVKVDKDILKQLLDDIFAGINVINGRGSEYNRLKQWDNIKYCDVEICKWLVPFIQENKIMFDATEDDEWRWNLKKRIVFATDRKDSITYEEFDDACKKFAHNLNRKFDRVSLDELNKNVEVSAIYPYTVCDNKMMILSKECAPDKFPVFIDDIFGFAVSKDSERCEDLERYLDRWSRLYSIIDVGVLNIPNKSKVNCGCKNEKD